MGFNYVCPTSGKKFDEKTPYCPVLSEAFKLTLPVFIHEYECLSDCEDDLDNYDMDHVIDLL